MRQTEKIDRQIHTHNPLHIQHTQKQSISLTHIMVVFISWCPFTHSILIQFYYVWSDSVWESLLYIWFLISTENSRLKERSREAGEILLEATDCEFPQPHTQRNSINLKHIISMFISWCPFTHLILIQLYYVWSGQNIIEALQVVFHLVQGNSA